MTGKREDTMGRRRGGAAALHHLYRGPLRSKIPGLPFSRNRDATDHDELQGESVTAVAETSENLFRPPKPTAIVVLPHGKQRLCQTEEQTQAHIRHFAIGGVESNPDGLILGFETVIKALAL